LVAEIVFVGNIENAARLAIELSQLLGAAGIAPRFQQRVALSESELVTQQQPNDPSHGTVWILVPHAMLARLVFADRTHMRFLVRDIPLPQGMDDVGREIVEQVIESSFLALMQGAAAVGRAEAHAALGSYVVSAPTESSPRTQVTQPKAPPAPRSTPWVLTRDDPSMPTEPVVAARTSRHLTERLGIGYGVTWTGSDFGVQHGPGLVAGLELVRRSDSFYIAGTFDWHFTQHHRTLEFELSLQNSRFGLDVGWAKPVSTPMSFVAAAGPGVAVTRVHTSSYAGASARPSPDSSSFSLGARLQGGLQWGNSPLVMQLLLRADVSVYDAQFEIIRNGRRETLAQPWLLRPGVTLGAVWR
jgi:hypothetical protein